MQNCLILKDWIQNISYGSGLVIPLHGLVLVSVVGNWSTYTLDILFLSNHNIHKSLCGHCVWASDPLIDGFS